MYGPCIISRVVTLTTDSLLTLNSNAPVTLGSPGHGYMTSVISATYTTIGHTVPFLGTTPRLGVFYKNFASPGLPNSGLQDMMTSVVDATVIQNGDISISENVLLMENQPLVFSDFSDWTNGDGMLRITLVYYTTKVSP